MIDDTAVIPLYDYPHLFKCLRNNLLTKDLELDFEENKKEEERIFVSWKHIILAYEIDVHATSRVERRLPKLTHAHVYEEYLKKMRVKYCTQVMSNSGANEIEQLSIKNGNYGLFFLYSTMSNICIHFK